MTNVQTYGTRVVPSVPLPADVSLIVTRRGRCTEIQLDFIAIDDRPPASVKVDRFADLATDRCWAAGVGERRTIYTFAGPVLWDLSVPNADAQRSLDALVALAHGDDGPIDALIAEWEHDPAPTLAQRLAARDERRAARKLATITPSA